jgi:hypothetical protein
VGITQTDLQSYADSAALAAAGELDRSSNAIVNATAAAAVITDLQTFGRGDRGLSSADTTLTFLTSLPPNDGTDTAGFVTTDPTQARFVRVDIAAHTVGLTFGAAFRTLLGSNDDTIDVTASAIAGNTTLACDVSTMMMCLPPGFNAAAQSGRVIQLRAGGQGGGWWAPGNFGFLLPEDTLSAVDEEGACSPDNFSGPVPTGASSPRSRPPRSASTRRASTPAPARPWAISPPRSTPGSTSTRACSTATVPIPVSHPPPT